MFLFLGNLLIDPEGRFSLVNIRNFNHEKTEAMENGGRAVKAFALERGNYDTIILGTSRVNHGINPTHPVFRSLQAYNAALPGANLYEIYQVFIFARKTHRLKTVLLGMDFSMFSSKQTVTGDFMDSLFAGRNSWLSNLHYLASFQTLLWA
ncbi:MAG: hypothetical protein HY268_07145 [Deltaproteobacteria bacterium]|nr:hypothetical protein [Deltaproteobacteria bacterium]